MYRYIQNILHRFVKYFAELRKQSLATTLLTTALVFVLQVDPKGKVTVQSFFFWPDKFYRILLWSFTYEIGAF